MFYKNIMQFAINSIDLASNDCSIELQVLAVIVIDNNIITFSDNKFERNNIKLYHIDNNRDKTI